MIHQPKALSVRKKIAELLYVAPHREVEQKKKKKRTEWIVEEIGLYRLHAHME